jgi:hypothetical protein
LAGRVHLIGTSGTLVGGDPWVPMSVTGAPTVGVLALLPRGYFEVDDCGGDRQT